MFLSGITGEDGFIAQNTLITSLAYILSPYNPSPPHTHAQSNISDHEVKVN